MILADRWRRNFDKLRAKPEVHAGAVARLQQSLRAGLGRADAYDLAAAFLFVTLILLVACTFRDYAISNDEEVQQRYGELILRYYTSGFTDQALFSARGGCVTTPWQRTNA